MVSSRWRWRLTWTANQLVLKQFKWSILNTRVNIISLCFTKRCLLCLVPSVLLISSFCMFSLFSLALLNVLSSKCAASFAILAYRIVIVDYNSNDKVQRVHGHGVIHSFDYNSICSLSMCWIPLNCMFIELRIFIFSHSLLFHLVH